MAKYDLFSKRHKALPDVFVYDDIPAKLRNQVYWLWKETILRTSKESIYGSSSNEALRTIHTAVCTEHGVLHLMDKPQLPEQEVISALLKSTQLEIVLDVIELSARMFIHLDEHYDLELPARAAIDELNHRFRENGVGYEFDMPSGVLIRVDNRLIHQEAVNPALYLLTDKIYTTANEEFLEAFHDYKKHDYDDCLTKCCSAFESVMKIVCRKKGWPYDEKDTASKLIASVIANADLPSYFAQPLTIIATLRNRLSKSHGAGNTVKHVPEHLARYSLHTTASAIVLVVDAAN